MELLKFKFTEVPTTSYGNSLTPRETPAQQITHRQYAFERHTLFFPAPDPDRDDKKATTASGAGAAFRFCRPKMFLLPTELVAGVRIGEGVVHALCVGVGRKSMDDRWMGRLFFQPDGIALLGLWRTWTGSQIFELAFRPVEEVSGPAGTSSSTKTKTKAETETTYAEPMSDASLPTRFPEMVLCGLRCESHPGIYSPKSHTTDTYGSRGAEEALVRSVLEESLRILDLLLKMRLGIDDGTWLTY